MPADDAIYEAVKNALVKDGWTITDDPYWLKYGRDNLYVDLAAERELLTAERGTDRIAVEIKSFLGPSILHDFEQAVGQFLVYRTIMSRVDPERRLILAVSQQGFAALQRKPAVQLVVEDQRVPILIVTLDREEVLQWVN